MAEHTIAGQLWPEGTVVSVYPAVAWVDKTRAPSGASVTSPAVVTNGAVTFGGLTEGTPYVAYGGGHGVTFVSVPVGLQRAVARPDRERLTALEDATSPTGTSGNTVDTGQHYRMIMFSNGTVKAIPFDTPVPVAPTGLAAIARLSSVQASWNSVAGATQYAVFRNGSQVGTSTSPAYRDIAITPSSTYTYQVQTVDGYGQRSPLTAGVAVFIDPATNSAPHVSIKTWPATLPVSGKALVRVNAADVDAQVLALTLSVDVGSLATTDDPSVWVYSP